MKNYDELLKQHDELTIATQYSEMNYKFLKEKLYKLTNDLDILTRPKRSLKEIIALKREK
ncbi:MAG: hypothetical protein CTY37_00255 [Methylotenera sp.]|nr:MAG: hypothetical protein CTY37_00255 [Methylotenera sp.]PPD19058.1 MAG: hypothetical protein CTY27_00100 [Methylotenera sp.]